MQETRVFMYNIIWHLFDFTQEATMWVSFIYHEI